MRQIKQLAIVPTEDGRGVSQQGDGRRSQTAQHTHTQQSVARRPRRRRLLGSPAPSSRPPISCALATGVVKGPLALALALARLRGPRRNARFKPRLRLPVRHASLDPRGVAETLQ